MQSKQAAIAAIAVIVVAIGIYSQRHVGLADNGDFTRGMTWFSTGPVGFDENWPPPGTEAYEQRFFNYWLPAWKLHLSTHYWMRSSAQLLWIPGILLNYLFISPQVLYLNNASLVPKLALLFFLGLFFLWISRSRLTGAQKTTVFVVPGLALALMFVNTEYLAFLSSFYFDSASYIFLLAFLATLVHLRRSGRSRVAYLLCLAALLLLTTAKPSTLYWLAYGLLFIIGLRFMLTRPKYVIVYTALVLALTPLCYKAAKYSQGAYDTGPAYHSLFVGVLMFSQDASQRLHELGIVGGEKCIGVPEYGEAGIACMEAYRDKISLANSLSVVTREPAILLRMAQYASNRMQLPTVARLVKHPIYDPVQSPPIGWNLWSLIKQTVFPRGYAFWGVLIICAIVFVSALRHEGVRGDLGLVGLACILATPIEMLIAIVADGPIDLMKHLFLANVLFDVAMIALLCLATICIVAILPTLSRRLRRQPPIPVIT